MTPQNLDRAMTLLGKLTIEAERLVEVNDRLVHENHALRVENRDLRRYAPCGFCKHQSRHHDADTGECAIWGCNCDTPTPLEATG